MGLGDEMGDVLKTFRHLAAAISSSSNLNEGTFESLVVQWGSFTIV